MKHLTVPTLIVTGDEDRWGLDPASLMKRVTPRPALVVLPQSGHTINLEEPDLLQQTSLRGVLPSRRRRALDAARSTRHHRKDHVTRRTRPRAANHPPPLGFASSGTATNCAAPSRSMRSSSDLRPALRA